MYGYIRGIVKEIDSNYIVLENNDIGYVIYVPNPYSYILNNTYQVYIYTKVAEDEYSLYGFKTREDKELFLKLISVKGLGPKMALPILATGSIEGIVDAIERDNILYLKKFPKIGDKLARQIILDLRGKLVKTDSAVNQDDELVEALMALGYKNADIKKILPKIDNSLSIEDKIKESLKIMLK